MTEQELRALLDELLVLSHETEWVEFKQNYANPQDIGENLSALSNSARLHNQRMAYIAWGIEDGTHKVLGTTFKPGTAKGKGNEPLESWLSRHLKPPADFRIYTFDYEPEKHIVVFEIDAARGKPVKFNGTEYIRVGETKKKLEDYPEKERRLRENLSGVDWSAEICPGATIDDLEPEATAKAKEQYRQKHPRLAEEIDSWDDVIFLNKAKLTIDGKITRTAILLLGNAESTHFLSPSVAQISWVLKDKDGTAEDYAHFGPPLILAVEEAFHKIRNLTLRTMPSGTLFPKEMTQYDDWVIREALHNAIAHQDYTLRGRITLVEKPSELIITNVGSFIPGSIEAVIQQDAPPSYYRNPFLADAMVNLNMIDTIGSGIKRMFMRQKDRFFPMPDFDLRKAERVLVRISGRMLDENYTRLLMKKTDMPLVLVMILDRVQKNIEIKKEEAIHLRREGFIEGRYPNVHISSQVAAVTGQKARYIKQRGLDESHYIELVLEFIRKYGSATRKDINDLLMDKLPEVLNEQQKNNKINRLLSQVMRKKLNLIENIGSDRSPKWVLVGSND